METIRESLALVFVLCCSCLIFAETVVLNDGMEVRGKLISDKEGMTGLECDEGIKVYFPTHTVRRIEAVTSPYELYLEYKKEVAKENREIRKSLMNWCKNNGLKNAYRLELVSLAFDDAKNGTYDETLYKPMEEVGYLLRDGKWLTKTEYNLRNGMVYFEGQWIRKDIKDTILSQRDYEKKHPRIAKDKEQKPRIYHKFYLNDVPREKKDIQKVCYLCNGTGRNRGFPGKCPNCKGKKTL